MSYSDYGDNDPIYGDDLADEDRESRPRLMLMGLRRSGKSSIQRVVFHKMSPTETLFLESTSKINKDNIHSFIDFQVWDFPGQMDFFDPTFDTTAIFGEVGALVFVIDSQDDYMEALARLHSTVVAAYRVNPNITFEVFIHKVDGLSEDYKIDTQRDIQQTTTDELADAGLENVQLAFYLTSIYDHSIFEAFSKVIQKLIPQLPTLENLLNILCANSGIEKAFLFDVISKIYIATDSSPVDSQSYEICSDMIDVIIDISSIYGRAAIGAKSEGYLEDQQDGHDDWTQQQDDYDGSNGNSQHPRQGTQDSRPPSALVSNSSRAGSLNNHPVRTSDNHEAFSVIKMGNGTVLYLREVNKYLALICLLRAETFEKQGLIDYNVHCFKEAMDQVFELKRAERTRREMEANQMLEQQQRHNGMYGHG
ncbi:Ras-related GTP-binding protein C/D [Entomortierella parvispora]|uniref:GTP-binding protein n=1 Tax=Entomortierella parvispora TaxID=205924 RepID=A0A9P3M101_9FUNG|nr:Ras-related GTP-binding protein C/D [Entomortierella parvispora]